ncbi:MAG: peptide chain release factor N(5)-glutamine methyltransferase [Candidatus Omnitrophica bacterium]|nr:peptide chain release factor N(5)-glutamine methyltransferase [Candidatus Omnitrophota bacterium]MDD5574281.1 peptide chain release factor N(5)-glutamine methyltransferase [Candidatus Omnitrophota bacterium]
MNEIESILCKVLDCSRPELYLDRSRRALRFRESRRLDDILRRRMEGEPLQYLLGDVDFMGLKLRVKPGVLVPRPETEVLVEEAVRRLKEADACCRNILEIGTGSGNIAIALASFLPAGCLGHIVAVDVSPTCLSVARSNARRCGVSGKITFLMSDLFSSLKKERFDVFISNPPYISRREAGRLPRDVQREPAQALLAGQDGLFFYRRIEQGARTFLKAGGQVFLEIGETQAGALRKIFQRRAGWSAVEFIKDLAGRDRVAVIGKLRRKGI